MQALHAHWKHEPVSIYSPIFRWIQTQKERVTRTKYWGTPKLRDLNKTSKKTIEHQKTHGKLEDCSILKAEEAFQGRGSDQFHHMLILGEARQELKVVWQCRGRLGNGEVMGAWEEQFPWKRLIEASSRENPERLSVQPPKEFCWKTFFFFSEKVLKQKLDV